MMSVFVYLFFLYCYAHHRDLHSFPTRRSSDLDRRAMQAASRDIHCAKPGCPVKLGTSDGHSFTMRRQGRTAVIRSEEHTSELQSRPHLVCRLLLEKKKKNKNNNPNRNQKT